MSIYNDPIEKLLDLIEQTRFEDFDANTVQAAKIFFMDTVGVACAGKLAPKLEDLAKASLIWGGGGDSQLWNLGRKAPACVAALVNGYQCHALEYDCVYEPGVILPTAPLFAALIAKHDELISQGRQITGADLLRAFVVGLEVSCTLAAAARNSMFFFRPATTGVFSALAAISCIDPLGRERLRHAFGIAYSQICGPMQAHEEGSMMLAMQMGFAARNAVQAHDMARAGMTGPAELLLGRFGFFKNFEHSHDLPGELDKLGSPWKVTQLSHKPFPSGRVTHGVIHAMRKLREEHGLKASNALDRIKHIRVELPPLGMRLVGRPMVTHPTPNYARLCIPYLAAAEVMYERVDPTTFSAEYLNNADTELLARRVETIEQPHPNPNAFYPQTLVMTLTDQNEVKVEIPYAWGHPLLPLSAQEREAKFRLCWRVARGSDATNHEVAGLAIDWLNRLDEATDTNRLTDLLT